jgi:hypothetical protein
VRSSWRGAQSVCPPKTQACGYSEEPTALAADPLRLLAEGAEPDLATSDTLCRNVGATEGSPNPAFAIAAACLSSGTTTRAARAPHDNARLEAMPLMSPGCLPSARCSTCDRVKPFAFPFDCSRKSSHPCCAGGQDTPRQPVRSAVPRYPAPPWFASRLPSTTRKRCFLPTSATDLRHEHP